MQRPQPSRSLFICVTLVAVALTSNSSEAVRGMTRRPAAPTEKTDARTASMGKSNDEQRQRFAEAYGQLPLSFEKNEGQTDSRAQFVARGRGYTLFLTRGGEAVLALSAPDNLPDAAAAKLPMHRNTGAVVRLKLVGANPRAGASGVEELPGKVNYLSGQDQARWQTAIPTYA
jgi:hypothetical protein